MKKTLNKAIALDPRCAVLAMAMMMDNPIIEELKLNLLDIQAKIDTLQATADAEKRDLAEDEQSEMNKLFAAFDQTEQQIERRQRIEDQKAKLAAPSGRQSEPTIPQPQAAASGRHAALPATPRNPAEVGQGGFKNFGEFAMSVKMASRPGNTPDPRLIVNAPTTYGNEGAGVDGGFTVPPDYKKDIVVKIEAEDSIMSMTDEMTSDSNTLVFPLDETTPWQTTGGIQAYWEGEGKQFTQSKPALQNNTIRLNKLTALVPVTEELLDDASAMDTYLRRKAPEKIDFKITDAIFNGNGVGMPLGILNSPALVSVAKETSQPADTIVAENLMKMWSRCYAPSRGRAAWFYNQDIEQQIMSAAIAIKNVAGTENVGGLPVFIPAGGLASSPHAHLFGRPMIATQAAQTLGDKGDIILGDLKQYLTAKKTQGIRQEVSIHLWFDYDVVAFKFVIRIAGQPWFSAPISPKNGSNTLSPFVALAERA